MMTQCRQRGFTLIELVTVMVVLGIIGVVTFAFVTSTVEGYNDQGNRSALVDDTTLALSRMARDIRAALPNSVRVKTQGSKVVVEVIHVVRGWRYRNGPGPNHHDDDAIIDFTQPDAALNVLAAPGATHAIITTGDRLAIANLGTLGHNAYAGTNVITPAGVTISLSDDIDETRVTLSAPFQFQSRSPARRVYLVSGAVSWVCDTATGTLTRYSGYGIHATQTVSPASAGTLAANHVAACDFSYTSAPERRNGVVTLQLKLTRHGESAALLEQVEVINGV